MDEAQATYATAEDIIERATEVRKHLALARNRLKLLAEFCGDMQWPSTRELEGLIEGIDTRIDRFSRLMEIARRKRGEES